MNELHNSSCQGDAWYPRTAYNAATLIHNTHSNVMLLAKTGAWGAYTATCNAFTCCAHAAYYQRVTTAYIRNHHSHAAADDGRASAARPRACVTAAAAAPRTKPKTN